MCGHRTIAQILGGYAQIQEMLSPTSVAILSLIFSDIRPQQRQGVGSHSGADKGIKYTFFEIVVTHGLFLMINLVARTAEMNN